MYYVNDGVYGSFNCVLYDHYVPEPFFLAKVRLRLMIAAGSKSCCLVLERSQ